MLKELAIFRSIKKEQLVALTYLLRLNNFFSFCLTSGFAVILGKPEVILVLVFPWIVILMVYLSLLTAALISGLCTGIATVLNTVKERQ